MNRIKRVLISVSDKTGLERLVRVLFEAKAEIISTGGTAEFIKSLGIPVTLVSEITGFPEMMNGRVKTLHPAVHGALLGLRDNPEHVRQMREQGIDPIDMLVVNLYPFEKVTSDPKVSLETAVENIDIGGPAMLRSAAKNSRQVAVVCRPESYPAIIEELKRDNGLSQETCQRLGREVFQRTAEYDANIAAYLEAAAGSKEPESLPERLRIDLVKVRDLRYGENPDQPAALYRDPRETSSGTLVTARQLNGKELSFNNFIDMEAALEAVSGFSRPAAVVIKHTNPCGAAVADDQTEAFRLAWQGDPLSAFGGIVGFNRPVEGVTARIIREAGFLECICAPRFEAEAIDILSEKKNLRLMEIEPVEYAANDLDLKKIRGGILAQKKSMAWEALEFTAVTEKTPALEEMESLRFAWKMVCHVKSNAIVIAKDRHLVGVGAGQTSRVDSVIIAVRKSAGRCRGAVLASDAFFPQPDSIEQAATAGISAIVQPGGSIKDKEVIAAANDLGIAMVVTGRRCFRH